MRQSLPCEQPDLALARHGVPWRPVHRARLLLHHPPAPAPDRAVEIVVERRDVGMRSRRPAGALGLAEGEALDKAERIGIPARQIEMFAQREMIEVVEEAHEIMGDEAPRRMLAQDGGLHPVVGGDLLRRKPPEIEPCRGVGLRHRQMRQSHVVERRQFHRPEHIAPGLVQLVRRLVARPQPRFESGEVMRTPGFDRVVAAIFIVGLPALQRRMVAERLRQQRDDARTFAQIVGRGEAVVAARAKAARTALLVHRDDAGMEVAQPLRRRCRRCAEHDLETFGVQHVHRAAQPVEIETALFRFKPAPGELADADMADAGLAHPARVPRPPGFGPVFGIVADAEHGTSQ